MQLIRQYDSLLEAENIAMALRHKGIVSYISSTHSYNVSAYITGAFQVGLWSVLDFQYNDACAFILNPEHEISSGITEEEMHNLKKQNKKASANVFNKLLIYVGVGFLFVFGLISYWVYSSGNFT